MKQNKYFYKRERKRNTLKNKIYKSYFKIYNTIICLLNIVTIL